MNVTDARFEISSNRPVKQREVKPSIASDRAAPSDDTLRALLTSPQSELTPLSISTSTRPAMFPSPFDEIGPHLLAQQAASALQQALVINDEAEGKVFGVLVVEMADGAFGYLRAFSGKWGSAWHVEGFAPPLFDVSERAQLEAVSDAVIKPLAAQLEILATSPELLEKQRALQALEREQQKQRAELKARLTQNRAQRATLRAAGGGSSAQADALSRADGALKRGLLQQQVQRWAQLQQAVARLERRVAAARRLLSFVSSKIVREIIALPRVTNAKGESKPVSALFSKDPPGGVGECAAPKLLAEAYRRGLKPVALAEFWWGPTQATGRVRGAYVPACKLKCGPLLPFMLEGLEVSSPRRVSSRLPRDAPLRVVYEDRHLRVIEKPEGLLSVSGREPTHLDAVETRMPGTWVVHRLDLDTSGLLVLALDALSHVALQQQFSRRAVVKRYVAVVEGVVSQDRGTIDLPLRVDVDDRPRQIHDPLRGKPALTHWQILHRDAWRTRLALYPVTGRTHQLRVHCAHPLGLATPIVGDRLYGHPAPRLLLHCAGLEFTHPVTGAQLTFEASPPF